LRNLWQKPYASDNKNKQTTNDSFVVEKRKNKQMGKLIACVTLITIYM
jgi:hypothetical protein